MSLNSTPNHTEEHEIEMLIIASISTLKSCSKKCGRDEVLNLVQTSQGTDTTRGTFDELLQNMVQMKAVNLQTLNCNSL